MMHIISEFRVMDKAELHEKLNAAVAAAHGDLHADKRHGVLVTRHGFDHFSVALSSNIPFGLIREEDQSRRD